jgi:hypothetical protein
LRYAIQKLLATDTIIPPGKTTNNFILIDTTGTLTRDNTRSNGWANELHPYTEGFTSLAAKFLAVLQAHYLVGFSRENTHDRYPSARRGQFAILADQISGGFAVSLAYPGSNITGRMQRLSRRLPCL